MPFKVAADCGAPVPAACSRWWTKASSSVCAAAPTRISSGVPDTSTRPACISEIRSQRMTSVMQWVDRKIVTSSCRDRSTSACQNTSRATGSTPELGSSKIRISGRWISATASGRLIGRLSSTGFRSNRRASSAMRGQMRAWCPARALSPPSTSSRPFCNFRAPAISASRLDLPTPSGSISPATPPAWRSTLTASSAVTRPYRSVRPSARTTAVADVIPEHAHLPRRARAHRGPGAPRRRRSWHSRNILPAIPARSRHGPRTTGFRARLRSRRSGG